MGRMIRLAALPGQEPDGVSLARTGREAWTMTRSKVRECSGPGIDGREPGGVSHPVGGLRFGRHPGYPTRAVADRLRGGNGSGSTKGIQNTIIALAVLCAATLSTTPGDVSAAVCAGDSAPAGAIWSTCLTVGVWDPPPGKIGGDVGYHSGLGFGSLSSTQFTSSGTSYTVKIVNLWYSRFYVQVSPDPGSAANNWVLHLGDDVALSFSDAEEWTWPGGRAVGGYRWESPGFSWTSDNEARR